ncbi:MAG: hypothetical protein WA191_06350 [Telluria sp.]
MLFSVLFTQLAVAGYACQSMQIAQAMQLVSAASGQQAMPDCEMGVDSSAQCQNLRPAGKQSMDKPEIPHVSPFVAAVLVQSIFHGDRPYPSVTSPSGGFLLTRTTAPPLSIQNCCFRI